MFKLIGGVLRFFLNPVFNLKLELTRPTSSELKAKLEALEKHQTRFITGRNKRRNIQAAGQSVNAMVDSQVDLFTEAPKVKEYNIEVLNSGGYLQLVAFWFENKVKFPP